MRIFLACLIGVVVSRIIFPNNHIFRLLLWALIVVVVLKIIEVLQIVILNAKINRLFFEKRMLGYALNAESSIRSKVEFRKVSIELEKTQKKLIEL